MIHIWVWGPPANLQILFYLHFTEKYVIFQINFSVYKKNDEI